MDGTEAIFVASTGGEIIGTNEHHSRRIIAGDAAAIRANLKFALEKLDYFVVLEQPSLIAKRKTERSDYGRRIIVGSILPHVKRLQISLVPATENSTEAVFTYAILTSVLWKGDRKTVEAEINALVALAASRRTQTVCPACGTSNTNDTRFCRVCGIENAAAEPAELEVLRLTASARTAHQTIVGGVIFILCWAFFFLPMWLISSQNAVASAVILGVGVLFGWLCIFYGMFRLHRALNPPGERRQLISPASVSGSISGGQTAFLPPLAAQTSVTEGTTELLNPPHKEETAVALQSKDTKNTNELY